MCEPQKSEASPAEEAAVNDKRARFDALPSLEVSSEEVRAIPTAKGGYIDRIIQWLQPKQVLGSYKNNHTGWDDIIVNKGSVRCVVHHDAGPGKTALLQAVPRLIRDGVYLTTVPKNKERLLSHIFAGKAAVDGVPYAISYVVREDNNGRRYYDHSLTEIEALDRVDDQALDRNSDETQRKLPGRQLDLSITSRGTSTGETFNLDRTPINTDEEGQNAPQQTGIALKPIGQESLSNILKKHLKVNRSAKNIS